MHKNILYMIHFTYIIHSQVSLKPELRDNFSSVVCQHSAISFRMYAIFLQFYFIHVIKDKI